MSRSRKRPPTTLEPGSRREHDLRHKVAALEAQLVEAEALNPVNGLPEESRRIVRTLVRTLVALEEAADPLRGHPIETQMRYRHPDSSMDEGASTRWARTMLKRIHSQVAGFASEYERRAAGERLETVRVEKVRCRNTSCVVEGKRIPRFVGPGNVVELVRCPKCDGKLSPA